MNTLTQIADSLNETSPVIQRTAPQWYVSHNVNMAGDPRVHCGIFRDEYPEVGDNKGTMTATICVFIEPCGEIYLYLTQCPEKHPELRPVFVGTWVYEEIEYDEPKSCAGVAVHGSIDNILTSGKWLDQELHSYLLELDKSGVQVYQANWNKRVAADV